VIVEQHASFPEILVPVPAVLGLPGYWSFFKIRSAVTLFASPASRISVTSSKIDDSSSSSQEESCVIGACAVEMTVVVGSRAKLWVPVSVVFGLMRSFVWVAAVLKTVRGRFGVGASSNEETDMALSTELSLSRLV